MNKLLTNKLSNKLMTMALTNTIDTFTKKVHDLVTSKPVLIYTLDGAAINAQLGTCYKLKLMNKVVYISFRVSEQFLITDVEISSMKSLGGKHKTFCMYQEGGALYNQSCHIADRSVSNVYLSSMLLELANQLHNKGE